MGEVAIRPAREADWAALNEIYNHYVRETPVTFDVEPFSLAERRAWFAQFGETGRYRLVTAAEGGRALGYAASLPFRPKPAYATSVETTVYLHPRATGRGLGAQLYGALFAALAGEDLHRAYAGIALPNPASVALHRRFGFEPVGVYVEVGHKLGRYWDVAWFEKRLR